MSIRDERQLEFAKEWLKTKWGILYLCPRFGKIFTSINIFEELQPKTILISYPDSKIKESWIDDFNKRGYSNEGIVYVTHTSLHKYIDEKFDVVIIDEIHELSEKEINDCRELFNKNTCVLGLTGTLSKWTEKTLHKELRLPVIARYPIELAIKEGVVCDYEINVIKVPLDNKIVRNFKKKQRTEKKQYDSISWIIKKMEEDGKNTMFLRLARMRLIQGSLAKLNKTKELLEKYNGERILVFCGTTEIADNLGIPSFHNKIKEQSIFNDFVEGKGNNLAVCKIGNTGVTYKPLNKVIVNYTNSNAEDLSQKLMRCMSMEYDNLDKKAHIYIISSNEPEEILWIRKALEFFDKNKIKFV